MNAQLKELLSRLPGHSWYHQRFDGSPLFLSLVGGPETRKEPRKPAGTEADWRICFYGQGKADWFLDQADIDRGAKVITEMAKDSATVSEDLMAAWRDDEDQFENYFQAFDSTKLADLSDESLLAEFNKYYTLAANRFTSSAIIDHFALGTDQLISDLLRGEVGKFGTESAFSEIFSIATAPVHQSFINEAEISLLRIALQVQNGADVKSDDIQTQLKAHQDHYYWTNNNYVKAQILSVKHFEEEINAWTESGKNLDEQIRDIEQTPARNKTAKAELFSRYQFSEHLKRLLIISENFTKWQDDRKRATYLAIDIGSRFLTEMAKRRNIETELLKYLISDKELAEWFVDNEVEELELNSRYEKCVVVWEDHVQQVFTGNQVDEIHETMLPSKVHDIQDIRGLVASTGKAIGIARIIMSAEEIGRVNEGDILIAVMTRPDYVPAMKKASAIVTDEGGITSHAAIVARELRIPCIIGTKIATKVFKDGDTIEVNANHNWIRKVNM